MRLFARGGGIYSFIANLLKHPASLAYFSRGNKTPPMPPLVPPARAERNPLEVSADFKHAITRAIKGSGSRAQLADHLSRLTGKNITEAQINNWTAESKPDRYPPPHYIAPICAWCGDWRPMQVLMKPYKQHVIDEKHKTLLEYGELCAKEQELKVERDSVHVKVHRAFFSGGNGQ